MHVSVVNSYAAASEKVPVSFVRSVDLPTEGNPIRPTRVSPACNYHRDAASASACNAVQRIDISTLYLGHVKALTAAGASTLQTANKRDATQSHIEQCSTARQVMRALLDGATSSLFNFASFAFNRPMCFAVALFFCVRAICNAPQKHTSLPFASFQAENTAVYSAIAC